MNTRQKLLSLAGTVIVAVLLTAPAVSCVVAACGLGACLTEAYLCALAGAVLCAAMVFSPKAGVPAAIVVVAGAGIYAALNLSGGSIAALSEGIRLMKDGGGSEALVPAAPLITGAGSAILSILIYVLISDRGVFTTIVAAALTMGMTIISSAAGSAEVPVWQLMPAALGVCLAFSHTAEQRMTGGHIKALIPAVIAVILAAVLVPASGTTFEPLENAANTVRSLYEDYFSYTRERVAFSISEEGYNYYGLRNDEPTHMLGGPADPKQGAVMRVETESDMLLRGTARSTYTGYSWEDYAAKSRVLYYDFTRRAKRADVFGTDLIEALEDPGAAFESVRATVTMLNEGSSTLFVPARLTDFDMTLKNALYYNSVGEMFLTRNVEKGDVYSFTALEPISPGAVSRLAAGMKNTRDAGYEEALRDYTQLPDGIDEGVYQIAEMFTEGAATDAEKAEAILNGLNANCAYRLDVEYPPQDRDFVSYFLLESREGYCSYFASAMAVMCRMEGIPARYVEGYRVYAEPDGAVNITGEDAHAWVEVYIKGIGWVAYDPTPGAETEDEPHSGEGPDSTPEPTPTPTPTPSPTPEPEAGDEPEPTPTPEPDSEDNTPEPTDEPSPEPTQEPTSEPDMPPAENDRNSRNRRMWLWIMLIVLAVLLIALIIWYVIRKRLEATDPIRLIARQKNDNRSVMILYRAMLTLLAQLGHMPQNGETPEAFAVRVCRSGLSNPDFEEFSRQVILTRYSRTPAGRELTSLGARAYLQFRQHMKRSERMRFDLHRALHGLGDFEQIP